MKNIVISGKTCNILNFNTLSTIIIPICFQIILFIQKIQTKIPALPVVYTHYFAYFH